MYRTSGLHRPKQTRTLRGPSWSTGAAQSTSAHLRFLTGINLMCASAEAETSGRGSESVLKRTFRVAERVVAQGPADLEPGLEAARGTQPAEHVGDAAAQGADGHTQALGDEFVL